MVSWKGINSFRELIDLVIDIVDNRFIVRYPELVSGACNDENISTGDDDRASLKAGHQ